MQNEELTQTYLSKSEDELLKLLSESDDLMPEARAILFSEAARRGLKVPAFAESTREHPDIGVKEQALEAGPFIAEVLRTVHSRFWAFVKLVGPAVVIGYVAVYWSGQEIRGIASRLRYLGAPSLAEVVKMSCLRLGGFFVSWIVFSFSYGAICAEISLNYRGVVASPSECFAIVLRRFSPLLRLVTLLFGCLLLVTALAMLLSSALYWLLVIRYLRLSGIAIGWCITGLVGMAWIALSRLALSIPAVVLGDDPVRRALFRSDELTEGKWLILAALVVKSVWGGYIAARIPYWIAAHIAWTVRPPWWFDWVLTGFSIAAVTAIEPYMFVGFALLYLRSTPAPALAEEAVVTV